MTDDFFHQAVDGGMYKGFPMLFRYGLLKAPCGYIIVKKLGKDEIEKFDQHIYGGITFNYVINVPKEFIDIFNLDIAPGKYKVIGFDMCHSYDFENDVCIRTIADCRAELERVIDIISS